MSTRHWRMVSMFVILIVAGIACSFIGSNPSQKEVVAAAVQTLSLQQTINSLSQSVLITPSPSPSPELPSDTPSPTTEPTQTPTATIVHMMQPADPPTTSNSITDLSSKAYALERRSIGDNFTKNLYERPFTSQVMDYQPYLDIVKSSMAYAAPWYYASLFVEGEIPADSNTTYAVELDTDLDGRGDFYVRVQAPLSSTWSTERVQVYRDTNNDVGGNLPITAENNNPQWNGYDELMFDSGVGADPDLAWARQNPTNPQQIQLAFKSSLLGVGEFVWGTWSDEGVQQPAWLDYNDHFTLAQAGHPSTNSTDYPLKEMASLDNTCRWAFGFTPLKMIPGLCAIPVTPTPVVRPTKTACEPPPNGCPVFGSFASHWNPKTCQCEIPPTQCQPPPNGCPVTARYVWDPVKCKCVLK